MPEHLHLLGSELCDISRPDISFAGVLMQVLAVIVASAKAAPETFEIVLVPAAASTNTVLNADLPEPSNLTKDKVSQHSKQDPFIGLQEWSAAYSALA